MDLNTKNCTCNSAQCDGNGKQQSKARKTIKAIPAFLLSIIIAFFPKCPICWAVYMSMLGSLGIANIPYLGWLFPVLLCFSGLHLWMLSRKTAEKGYGPFSLSLIGFMTILAGRAFDPSDRLIAILGMGCIISGSMWNSFSSVLQQKRYN